MMPRAQDCKHLIAVRIVIQRELFDDGTETVTKTVTVTEKVHRKTYQQDWPNYNRSQVNEHRLFQRLLADLCGTLPTPAPQSRAVRPLLRTMPRSAPS